MSDARDEPVSVTPAGASRVAPWIISRDTVAEIEFLGAVFDAVEAAGARIMNGDRVGHAEIDLAGMTVLMFDADPAWPPTPAHMRLYVEDVQRTLRAATERGARVVTEPTELAFGDVVARFRDPQGHLWWIHQHVEDVDPAELGQRFQQEAAVKAMLYVGDTLNQDMARSRPAGDARE
jgi:PhnB protein